MDNHDPRLGLRIFRFNVDHRFLATSCRSDAERNLAEISRAPNLLLWGGWEMTGITTSRRYRVYANDVGDGPDASSARTTLPTVVSPQRSLGQFQLGTRPPFHSTCARVLWRHKTKVVSRALTTGIWAWESTSRSANGLSSAFYSDTLRHFPNHHQYGGDSKQPGPRQGGPATHVLRTSARFAQASSGPEFFNCMD